MQTPVAKRDGNATNRRVPKISPEIIASMSSAKAGCFAFFITSAAPMAQIKKINEMYIMLFAYFWYCHFLCKIEAICF
jgi:hypothetical protein